MTDSTKELVILLKHYIDKEIISKAELCRKTGISRSNLDLILKGRSSPTLYTLDRIASALQINPADAIRGTKPIKPQPPHTLEDCFKAIRSAAEVSKPHKPNNNHSSK